MKGLHASKALLAVALVTTVFASQALAGDHSSKKKDIVETAVSAGSFNTLATALTEAGLIETLKGEGPFTVFAPTDEAFAKIPEATLTALLKDKKELTRVLLYHVVAGNVMSSDVVKLTSAKTVEGSEASISVNDGTVMVDKAKVLKVDIKASNGVIHVIDTVLLPPAEKASKKSSMY
jgi:uncharacterized surface protein with fasciclin (FAS1) repeats